MAPYRLGHLLKDESQSISADGGVQDHVSNRAPCESCALMSGAEEGQVSLKIKADDKVRPHHFSQEKTAIQRS